MLKNPIRFGNEDTIEQMFVTCCATHNALLAHDKMSGFDEETIIMGDSDDNMDNNTDNNSTNEESETEDEHVLLLNNVRMTTLREFHERREALVKHYKVCVMNWSLKLDK